MEVFLEHQNALNTAIAEMAEEQKRLAGLPMESFRNHFYDVTTRDQNAKWLEQRWLNMKFKATNLAKLQPPEDVTRSLFSSAYDALSALLRYVILNQGIGRGHYYAESFLAQIRSGRDELMRLNPAASGNAEAARCEQLWNRMGAFEVASKEAAFHGMIHLESYGLANERFLAAVRVMSRPEAESILRQYQVAKVESTLEAVTKLDPQMLLQAVWFFAMEKPLQTNSLVCAQDLCKWYFNGNCPDVKLTEWYVQRDLSGADAVPPMNEKEYALLSGQMMETLASGLMWLQCYHQEKALLQGMMTANRPMSAMAQLRLHTLINGRSATHSSCPAAAPGEADLCFDISALTWRDAEYDTLFENLTFQCKNLTYGLAIRDEDNSLSLPAGITLPDKETVLTKFRADLQEEYGDQVAAQAVSCIMLSGSGQERMDGILVSSGGCRQLGIAVNLARIGKKVNIKFYTIFLPVETELALQKQQALSLYKKLSPSATMWESSLKGTLLTAIQQLLNSSVQGVGTPITPSHISDGDAPIF